MLEGLDGEVERRGKVGRRERETLEGADGARVQTGRILPTATRPLRLAVLSLRFGALQPPVRSSDFGTKDFPSEDPISAKEAELLVRGGRRAVETERDIVAIGRAVEVER